MTQLILVLISMLLMSCQNFQKKDSQLDLAKLQQAKSCDIEFLDSLKKHIRKSIRSEILPEIREITVLSKKLKKKQIRAKDGLVEKLVVGRVEWIEIDAPTIRYKARVDTGAQTSSIHAENITEKIVGGEQFVEFTTRDFSGNEHKLLKKVIKNTKVKGTTGKAGNRYVIKLTLNFGGRSIDSNVNLNDRSNLRHKFLIGRNLLIGDYIVDVSQSRILGGEK